MNCLCKPVKLHELHTKAACWTDTVQLAQKITQLPAHEQLSELSQEAAIASEISLAPASYSAFASRCEQGSDTKQTGPIKVIQRNAVQRAYRFFRFSCAFILEQQHI